MPQETQSRANNGWIIALFVLTAIGLIWALSSARRANTSADANQDLLNVPRLSVTYTVGGPERFAEPFQSALEEVEEDGAAGALEPADLLWSALLIGNDGFVDADDVALTVPLAAGLEPAVVAEIGGFNGIEIEATDVGLSLELGDVDAGDMSYVFLGFDPAALDEDVAAAWARSFETTVGTISAETEGDQATFYGEAL